MLSNQAKRQGSFYVCAPCRRQYQQNLAQLRSQGRTQSLILLAKLPSFPATSRPDSTHYTHPTLPPTGRRIDTRGYAAWGKFGSNTSPGQSNSGWGGALKKPSGDKSDKPSASGSGWGGGFGGSNIPRSHGPADTAAADPPLPPPPPPASQTSEKSKPDLKLSWEALNPSSSTKPEPTASQVSSNSKEGSSANGSQKLGTSALDNLFTRANPKPTTQQSAFGGVNRENGVLFQKPKQEKLSFHELFKRPNPRPAPPGAEFPNLLRKDSNANSFRSMSPWNLPSAEERRSRGRPDGSSPEVSDFGAVRTRGGFLDDLPPRQRPSSSSLGSSNGMNRTPPPLDDLSRLSSSNEMSRDPPPRDDWSLPTSNNDMNRDPPSRSRYPSSPPSISDGRSSFTDLHAAARAQNNATPRPAPVQDDWGLSPDFPAKSQDNTKSRAAPAQDELGRSEDAKRSKERNTERYVNSRSRDEDEPDYIIRGGRKEKGKDKQKTKNNRRSSHRGAHEDEYDDLEGLDFEDYRDPRMERRRKKEERRAAQAELAPKSIVLPEYITVFDLAEALRVKPKQFLDDLEALGFENTLLDSLLTGETAALVAAEFGFEASLETGDGIDLKPRPAPEDPTTLPPRPPVVTIMGHVDHGKTTMLDWMRKSSVAAQEHGGITQHIGAFSVKLRTGKVITFLDTPGHAAFLNMRQRGAYVTDIVVLVVAVDDSVMPQTIEALKHAQNAKVPIIVAVNKIDVDPNRIGHVKQDLANNGVEIEDFGGDVQVVPVSGKTGEGMDDLEECILTLSEILDLRAERDGMAEGWVLEASTKKEGKAATILVKRGTLRVGDLIVAGTTYTRIRIMRNEAGVDVEEAPPGTAVEIFGGWSEPPVAGDMVLQAPDEDKAQIAVDYRLELGDRAAAAAQKVEQDRIAREKAEKAALEKMMEEEGEANNEGEEGAAAEPVETGPKIVNFIVRGDVMGSVEAVTNSIMEIGNNEVRPRILRSLPGAITESDVDLLATATGFIVNFNNAVPGFIRRQADQAGVEILDHNIIYEVVDNVKLVLSRDLAPIISQRVLAEAEVLQIFAINTVKRQYKNIAGVKVRMGQVTRGGLYRVMRGGEKIHDGKLDALKEGKKNATEIRKGSECGMSFESFDDFQAGDVIQLYEEIVEKRYL